MPRARAYLNFETDFGGLRDLPLQDVIEELTDIDTTTRQYRPRLQRLPQTPDRLESLVLDEYKHPKAE